MKKASPAGWHFPGLAFSGLAFSVEVSLSIAFLPRGRAVCVQNEWPALALALNPARAPLPLPLPLAAQSPENSTKLAISLLHYCGELPGDKLFYEAGMLCKDIGWTNMAFVFLNRRARPLLPPLALALGVLSLPAPAHTGKQGSKQAAAEAVAQGLRRAELTCPPPAVRTCARAQVPGPVRGHRGEGAHLRQPRQHRLPEPRDPLRLRAAAEAVPGRETERRTRARVRARTLLIPHAALEPPAICRVLT